MTLTLEQELFLEQWKRQLENLSAEEMRETSLEMLRLLLVTQNAAKRIVENSLIAGAGL